jgi:hypothetical protein
VAMPLWRSAPAVLALVGFVVVATPSALAQRNGDEVSIGKRWTPEIADWPKILEAVKAGKSGVAVAPLPTCASRRRWRSRIGPRQSVPPSGPSPRLRLGPITGWYANKISRDEEDHDLG